MKSGRQIMCQGQDNVQGKLGTAIIDLITLAYGNYRIVLQKILIITTSKDNMNRVCKKTRVVLKLSEPLENFVGDAYKRFLEIFDTISAQINPLGTLQRMRLRGFREYTTGSQRTCHFAYPTL